MRDHFHHNIFSYREWSSSAYERNGRGGRKGDRNRCCCWAVRAASYVDLKINTMSTKSDKQGEPAETKSDLVVGRTRAH